MATTCTQQSMLETTLMSMAEPTSPVYMVVP